MLITALGVQNCEQTTTHWLLLPQIKGHISYPALEVTLQLIPEQRTGLPQEHTPFGMAREKPVCISTNLTSMWLFLQQSQKLYKKKKKQKSEQMEPYRDWSCTVLHWDKQQACYLPLSFPLLQEEWHTHC